MNNQMHNILIHMVDKSTAPLILFDNSFAVIACSVSFRQTLVSFDDNIHTLFDSNAIQRIKRSRKQLSSIQMKTKTLPFTLYMSLNWIPIDEETIYLMGVVEKNQLSKANRSLVVAYSCVERSQQALSSLNRSLSLIRFGENVEDEIKNMNQYLHTLTRNYDNLLNCVTLLTDDLILNTRNQDIVRIIRHMISSAQKQLRDRNIRIRFTLPRLACLVNCDLKRMVVAFSDCLYTILYFTQNDHHISIDLLDHTDYYEIIFTDPLFKSRKNTVIDCL